MPNGNNKTFVRVTNHEIYDKLLDVEEKIGKINGKVNVNRWIATTAITLSFILLGFLVNNIVNS